MIEQERALNTLDLIRAALESKNLQEAIKQIDTLQHQLVDWKRMDAQQWLDEALRADLLLFNIEAANRRLDQWEGTLEGKEDRELNHYRERVRERTRQKQLDLQARGVVAHCQELWRQAETLEGEANPPTPEYMLENYYIRVRDVAQAATYEFPDNANLKSLVLQAEQLLIDKERAAQIYPTAILEDRYADALDEFAVLEAITHVPHYRRSDDPTSSKRLIFDGMVTLEAAKAELEGIGKRWAHSRVGALLQNVHDHLTNYRPQEALNLLHGRKRIERFTEMAIRDKLLQLENQAQSDLEKLDQAERRAQMALRLMQENPLGAWELYAEAHNTYAGAPSVAEARMMILSRLTGELKGRISEAEKAFDTKNMRRIGELYRQSRADYSDKAPELEALLSRLEEIDWQARTYLEYLQSASEILEQLRSVVWEDVSVAGEMLNRLDEYPAIVLDELSGLSDIRATVRRRLNVEMSYNRLYQLMLSDSVEEVEQGIASAEDYADDNRFRQLIPMLDAHMTYLNAHLEYDLGQLKQALSMFEEVAAYDNHPDQPDAARFADEIRSRLTAPPPVEEVEEPDSLDDELSDDIE